MNRLQSVILIDPDITFCCRNNPNLECLRAYLLFVNNEILPNHFDLSTLMSFHVLVDREFVANVPSFLTVT